jgi:hypothetical protein
MHSPGISLGCCGAARCVCSKARSPSCKWADCLSAAVHAALKVTSIKRCGYLLLVDMPGRGGALCDLLNPAAAAACLRSQELVPPTAAYLGDLAQLQPSCSSQGPSSSHAKLAKLTSMHV